MTIPVEPVAPLTEVVDAAIEAYVEWREESAATRVAYRRWSTAVSADRLLAFCAYVAALDREELAATVYADAMRRLGEESRDAAASESYRASMGTQPSRPDR